MSDKQRDAASDPSKRLTLKRLVVFLLISFGLPYIMIFIYIAKCGWTTEGSFYGLICSVAMLCPAIANILTRIITKEGTSELLLSLNFKGKPRYYGTAIIMPVVCAVLVILFTALFILPAGSLGEIIWCADYKQAGAGVLYLISMSLSAFMFGFGEEFGWRGYLTPKLEKLMPASAAVVLTGIIWGLWHAPLIACGHNLGKGYPGDPWLGILLMCISCIGLSLYLTALTNAASSSLAAGIAHMAINNITASLAGIFLSALSAEKLLKLEDMSFAYSVINMSVLTFVGAAVGIILLLIVKKKAQPEKNLHDSKKYTEKKVS